jgi:hypothetical protein
MSDRRGLPCLPLVQARPASEHGGAFDELVGLVYVPRSGADRLLGFIGASALAPVCRAYVSPDCLPISEQRLVLVLRGEIKYRVQERWKYIQNDEIHLSF